MVSQQLIEELKTIIEEEHKKNLEIEKVTQIANNLVSFFNLLVKIHHREEDLKNKYNYKDKYESRK